MNHGAPYFIEKMGLLKHPEGGFYKEFHRTMLKFEPSALPPGFSGPRNAATSIFYLLESHDCSHFHRILSDEIWYFHAGDPLVIYTLDNRGVRHDYFLGLDAEQNQQPQVVVNAGCWFAAEVIPPGRFTLVGCNVSPGFDFADFELGNRHQLIQEYPEHAVLINRFTK